MPAPGIIPHKSYRTEEVDLQPGGSTIAVTCPSDNPFEATDDVVVVTQASGGMAGADPRQRSRKVVYAKPARHVNAGFLPGMGDGEEIEIGLQGVQRKVAPARRPVARPRQFVAAARTAVRPAAGFLPGMGDDQDFLPGMGDLGDAADAAALKELDAFTAEVNERNAATRLAAAQASKAEAEASAVKWGAVGKAASGVAEQLAKRGPTKVVTSTKNITTAPPSAPGLSAGAKVGLGIGAVAVIGLVVLLVLKK